MKIVNTGSTFKIYSDNLRVMDRIPAATYAVSFNKEQGFILELQPDIVVKEKTYGVLDEKVNKVLNTFDKFERNLGVILSGKKGIGKSMYAKLLAQRAVSKGLPLFIVNNFIPGIADYLASIEQEAVVLFDEFDKTFNSGHKNDIGDPQTEMLTLFDGLYQGKKLFVVTCNDLHNLNDYLVNRPGRFHYHFRFECPNADEIREYLKDKMSEEYHKEIEEVVKFSGKVEVNYDCLRAIAFEIQNSGSFKSAIKDLNIVNNNESATYEVIITFESGYKTVVTEVIDMFSTDEETVSVRNKDGRWVALHFVPAKGNLIYDKIPSVIMTKDNIVTDYEEENNQDWIAEAPELYSDKAESIVIRRKPSETLHFTV